MSVLSTLSRVAAKAYSARSRTSMCAPRASSPRREDPRDMNWRSTGRKNLLAVAACCSPAGRAVRGLRPGRATARHGGAVRRAGQLWSDRLHRPRYDRQWRRRLLADARDLELPALHNGFPLHRSPAERQHGTAGAYGRHRGLQLPRRPGARPRDRGPDGRSGAHLGHLFVPVRCRRLGRQRDPHSQWPRDLRLPGG